jgi:hypothetical protein
MLQTANNCELRKKRFCLLPNRGTQIGRARQSYVWREVAAVAKPG